MPWRPSRPPGVAERRLQRVASSASPGAAGPGPGRSGSRGPDPIVWSAWRGPAVRGLALVVAAVVVVVGYQAWGGRARAVAEVPVAVSTGSSAAPGAAPSRTMMPTAAAVAPTILASEPPPGPDASRVMAPSPAPEASPTVVVHVVGFVIRPGLVTLPAGSRVADAIEAAGGLTRPRAADTVNLARLLVDGEQVAVGRPALPGSAGSPTASGSAGGAMGAPLQVDLNTASAELLDGLPGIGPVIAGRIVSWRTANGPFRSVDELGEVSGIGDAILGQIRDLVRV